MPTVSCILPVFNAADFLSPCLDALRAQRDVSLEIIAVNDGSTDDSLAILHRHAEDDDRIRVMSQPNAGGAAARNRAIEQSTGEYIMLQDADDLSHPQRARLQIEFFESHPEVDMLGSTSWILSETDAIIGQIRPPQTPAEVQARMKRSMAYCHSSLMFRRCVFFGPQQVRYDESFISAHDYEMLLRAHENFVGANYHLPLYGYRVSGNQLSIRHVESGAYRSLIAGYYAHHPELEAANLTSFTRADVHECGFSDDDIDEFMVGRFRYAVHVMMLCGRRSLLAEDIERYIQSHRPGAEARRKLLALLAVARLTGEGRSRSAVKALHALARAGARPFSTRGGADPQAPCSCRSCSVQGQKMAAPDEIVVRPPCCDCAFEAPCGC